MTKILWRTSRWESSSLKDDVGTLQVFISDENRKIILKPKWEEILPIVLFVPTYLVIDKLTVKRKFSWKDMLTLVILFLVSCWFGGNSGAFWRAYL